MDASDASKVSTEPRLAELENQLRDLDAARASIVRQIEALRMELAVSPRAAEPQQQDLLPQTPPATPEAKADLFLTLFGARRDVFPKLWENPRTGRKGYSPACLNEWAQGTCKKPQVKCTDCPNQGFPPLDRHAVLEHLRGHQTIGVYAIRPDDSCIFLAADFDGAAWREDAAAYRDAAAEMGIRAAIERSRSGDGAHAWIFFAEAVPAGLARRLGTILMARTTARRPDISVSSYDRLFPSQDVLPPGGFGNLIALPLQRRCRDDGNTVFLDADLAPIPDQWAFLAGVQRLDLARIRALLQQAAPGLERTDRWGLSPEIALACDDRALDTITQAVRKESFRSELLVTINRHIEIPTSNMPGALKASLKRLAILPNPQFYERQRLRFTTYNIPRFIFCGETHGDRLRLPRGCWQRAKALLERAGATVRVEDQREEGAPISVRFQGELTADQGLAVAALMEHDTGVLVAPPGSGKTVMACALIARRGVRTLILAHRAAILEQWIALLGQFLGLSKGEIWKAPGRRHKDTAPVGVAMLQTMARAEDPHAYLSGFGQVIIDECHHVPAASFEAAVKHAGSRYILGLTATPRRKDGLERILFMQCGPIRHSIGYRADDLPRTVLIHTFPESEVRWPPGEEGDIHRLWAVLLESPSRNRRIAKDLMEALHSGRFCVLLSDRKEHLRLLAAEAVALAPDRGADIVLVDGSMTPKERRQTLAEVRLRCDAGRPFALLSTAALLGEGFDLPRLDTLLLAMPISFKGRLIQYAGRLHRPCPGKQDVRVFDYVETGNPLSLAMHRRRLGAFRDMGYAIHHTAELELSAVDASNGPPQ